MPKRRNQEEEEEEEEDDQYDDFDDEEEEEDEGRPTKRRKASSLVDVEAGVSDNEDEEDYEDAEDGFIDHTEDIASSTRGAPRGTSSMDMDMRMSGGREKRGADYLNILENKYANADENEDDYAEVDDYDDEGLDTLDAGDGRARNKIGGTFGAKDGALPTINDPKLFLVKCRQGKEKYAVATLLQKFLNLSNDRDKDKRLQIVSALCVDGFKGHIYVEAFREAHVKHAIQGLNDVIYQSGIKLVPLGETADVLTTGKKAIDIKKGEWVRVKRGLYKGDLAQVWDVDEARGAVSIKIVPRLNLSGPQPSATQIHNRPNPRLFNEEEFDDIVTKRDPRTNIKFSVFQGKKYKDGLMFKLVNIKSLDTKDIQPKIEELKLFQRPGVDGDIQLSSLAESFKKTTVFKKGDSIMVTEGEMTGLTGIVHAVNGDLVTFFPKDKAYNGLPLEATTAELQKYFEAGSFCRVTSGKYEGEVGYIVEADGDTVVMYSDMKKTEMKVFVSDIQLASATEDTQTKTGIYSLHDMIKLDNNTMGVIVKIDKDQFNVLDNNGTVRTLRLQEMGPKRNTTEYKMSDKNNIQFGVGASLRVVDGVFKGREGTARQLFRAFVFIRARDLLENSGIFVTRADYCEVRGNRLAQQNMPAGNMPAPKAAPPRGVGRGVMFRGRSTHPLMDKTVRIKIGPFKGYIGIVKDVMDDSARVELHSRMKTINIKIANLKEEGAENPAPIQNNYNNNYDNYGPRSNVRRFDDGGRTPLRPSFAETPNPNYPETPRTPSHDRTWHPNAPNTPRHDWGSDSRVVETPSATTPSVMTPYSSGDQGQNYRAPVTPGYNPMSGSHETPMSNPITPAVYSDHYRTPGANYSHPTTPGAYHSNYNVITPTANYNPITPGAGHVSTPGGDMSHSVPRTPGNAYATPGVHYNPTTPGVNYNPTTPGVNYNPITPGVHYNPTTPGVNYHPATPGSSLTTPGVGHHYPYQPTTPYVAPVTPGVNYSSSSYGGGYDGGYSHYDNSSWVDKGMRVRIEDHTSSYNGYRGVIQSVNHTNGTCKVVLDSNEQQETVVGIKMEHIRPDMPRKGDRVIIIKSGESRGREADVLHCSEGSVAVRVIGETQTDMTLAATDCVPLAR